ncbi:MULTISPECIES: TetR/AcrR family transcriptional regulator [unclassified Adlercreutzia]|uniref:TetR/AcrR family transcriptional regulator n=1 Tax=unclassified Adlercreutzia TaxID=2636013 RepID=UPI002104DB44|nr:MULTISPECIES: TetR/AcrR family transcriptional regulator [unclassified Adlercreutzia]
MIRESLVTRGLDATSYQLVAEEAGISRALVQHYYPRKMDFAAEYLNGLLSTIADMLGIVGYGTPSQLSYLDAHRIGCLYYGYLLSKDGGRRLLYDMLKDRELADELMRGHYEWGLENLDPTRPAFESRSQRVIEVWGGFYELMYYSIKQGFEIDAPSKSLQILEAFHDGAAEPFDLDGTLDDGRPDARLLDELKARLSGAAAASPKQNPAPSAKAQAGA